jgi:putative restriction endonuclease
LFDTGYATVTQDLHLEISARLREDYRNGRSYYPLQGAHVQVPRISSHQPDKAFLEWHNEHVFRG